MRAGTQLDPFPNSYENDPMVARREEPPRDPDDEEEEEEESEDLRIPKRKSAEDPDEEAEDTTDLRAAMAKLEGKSHPEDKHKK